MNRGIFERLWELLTEIRDYGHTDECTTSCAPVYECGCQKKSQSEMAEEALHLMSLLE